MKKLIACCALGCLTTFALADGVDGLRHWWRVRDQNGDGLLQPNEVYDALTVGSDSPVTATKILQCTDTDVPEVDPVSVSSGMRFATMRRDGEDDVLNLNNPTNYANGKLMANFQSVELPKASCIGATQATVAIRFKWNGTRFANSSGKYGWFVPIYANNYDCYNGAGWCVGLNFYDTGTRDEFYPAIRYGTQSIIISGSGEKRLRAGMWYEVVYSFLKWTDDAGKARIAPSFLLRCASTSNALYRRHYYTHEDNIEVSTSWSQYETGVYPPHIGHYYVDKDNRYGTTNFVSAANGDNAFCGAIHEIKVYDRAMGEREMLQTIGDLDPLSQVGTANGSADEFGGGETADPYEPQTMPWSRMRKTLARGTPLSVRWHLAEDGHAQARFVELYLLGASSFGGARVSAAMNGRYFGELPVPSDGILRFFLSSSRLAQLPKDVETKTYPLTLTFARTDATGPVLKIDALSVRGSWQLGAADGKTSEFGGAGSMYFNQYFAAGDTNLLHLSGTISNQENYGDMDVFFELSDWAAANLDHVLTAKPVNTSSGAVDIRLNSETENFCVTSGSDFWGDGLGKRIVIPKGTLNGGGNLLRFHAETKGWTSFDFIRLEPLWPDGWRNSDHGFIMILR